MQCYVSGRLSVLLNNMYKLLRPLVFCCDPEFAHRMTQRLLRWFGKRVAVMQTNPIELFGITFPNRVGLAAGWDKDGECIDQLFGLGFGFVEVGTVTPRPQAGNPRPRLFRITRAQAIINRMGFNNKGVDNLIENLKRRTVPGIIGINIGKNKDTPNECAYEDYVYCLQKSYEYADYIVINISSPNTPGLRDLHEAEQLTLLLSELNKTRQVLEAHTKKHVPLLIKLSPDFPHKALEEFVNIAVKHGIEGIIATNTSVSRENVEQLTYADEAGGLSGRPIAKRSTATVAEIKKITHGKLPVIGVGGIDSVAAAQDKFAAGAELIQLFTGLIYQGPGLIRSLIQRDV